MSNTLTQKDLHDIRSSLDRLELYVHFDEEKKKNEAIQKSAAEAVEILRRFYQNLAVENKGGS